MPVSFSLMANLPANFSQTTCIRFGGEKSSETYFDSSRFYVFLLVVCAMRILVLPSFSDDVFSAGEASGK